MPYKNLKDFRFPAINATSLEAYANAGLATQAINASGIVFQLDWGTKQFNAFLRCLFPALFAHFDMANPTFKSIRDEPDNIGLKRIEYTLPYVLLKKEYRKYTIVDDTHPVAAKYKDALSGEGTNAGFRAKSIFIGESLSFITMVHQSHTSSGSSHQSPNPPISPG
jgi:hypothetical protein